MRSVGPLSRVEALSDGVVAIAITLLALGIDVPDATGTGVSVDPVAFLQENLGHLEIIAVTFFAVAFFWMIHHRMFQYLTGHDHWMLWLNTVFLLLLSLLPFTSEFAGEFGGYRSAVVTHFGLMVATALSQTALWLHAIRGGRFVTEDAHPAELHRVTILTLVTAMAYVAAIGVAFIDTAIARKTWLLLLALSPLVDMAVPVPDEDAGTYAPGGS